MDKLLTESENYKVVSSFEIVELFFKNQLPSKIVGDFYGDPECAIISKNEKYLVMAGCGLIIYKLEKPFIEFNYKRETDQYFEFKREARNIWWIESLHLCDDDKHIIFSTSKNKKQYKMNFETLDYKEILI